MNWLRRLFAPRHQCWPPGGVRFTPDWTCPECGTKWTLITRANVSEWVRDDS